MAPCECLNNTENGPSEGKGEGGVYEVAGLCFDLFFAKGLTIFQCAETVNNAGPLCAGTRGRHGGLFTWGVVERL